MTPGVGARVVSGSQRSVVGEGGASPPQPRAGSVAEAGSGLRGALSRALRFPGSGSKQLHVFQHYVLQQIPGIALSLPFNAVAFAIRFSRREQFVGPKRGQ